MAFSLGRGRRVDPLRVDLVLAAVLLVGAELEIWLTHDAGRYQLVAALAAPVLTACVAVRRLHPFLAGLVAQGTMAFVFAVWGNTQIFGNSIA